jgi:hypothetical protein
MLVIFLLIIVAGLAVFFFVFIKEFKEGSPRVQAQAEPHLQDFDSTKNPVGKKAVESQPPKPPSGGSAEREELKDIKDALVQKLDQKCVKLEQILEEKNRILARFEEDLKHEQTQRQEFDGVRAILQQQIEELKLQNKQLKEEMARILEENLALQSKTYGLEKALGKEKAGPAVEPGILSADPILPDSLTIGGGVNEKTAGDLPRDGLTLSDVFGEDPDNKKE